MNKFLRKNSKFLTFVFLLLVIGLFLVYNNLFGETEQFQINSNNDKPCSKQCNNGGKCVHVPVDCNNPNGETKEVCNCNPKGLQDGTCGYGENCDLRSTCSRSTNTCYFGQNSIPSGRGWSFDRTMCLEDTQKKDYCGNPIFNSNRELKNAVDMWTNPNTRSKAFNTYGEINTWNTSEITNMSKLFYDKQLFNDDINNWDVSSVTNMTYMFQNAYVFDRELNNWNVSNVTNMSYMFYGAKSFNKDLNNWKTGSVTNMSGMFYLSESFNGDISSWDTSSVTNMFAMFNNAYSFNSRLNDWDIRKVTNRLGMVSMFSNASAFNQPLNKWDTSNVTSMVAMFEYAYAFLNKQNHRDFANKICFDHQKNPSKRNTLLQHIKMPSHQCQTKTTQAPVGLLITTQAPFKPLKARTTQSPVTNYLFNSNQELKKAVNLWTSGINGLNEAIVTYGKINTWNTSEITDMGLLFFDKQSFNDDINNWDVSSVTNMVGMFANVTASASAFNKDLNNWDTSSVTNMSGMFYKANAFNGDISSWDTSSVTDMDGMFNRANVFDRPLNEWNTGSVTNMETMFYKANAFNQELNNWDTSNVTNMGSMFVDAKAFDRPLNEWNTGSVTDMTKMFYGATDFNQPLNKWDTSNVTHMTKMFVNANAFLNKQNHIDFANQICFGHKKNPERRNNLLKDIEMPGHQCQIKTTQAPVGLLTTQAPVGLLITTQAPFKPLKARTTQSPVAPKPVEKIRTTLQPIPTAPQILTTYAPVPAEQVSPSCPEFKWLLDSKSNIL
jgi:surface protein